MVPGGWSIGVEFTFYAVFPLVAIYIRSMRAALIFCAATVLVGSVADPIARNVLADLYGETATADFLYFWFPNQVPVLALGTVLFHALRWTWDVPDGDAARFLRGHANAILATCLGALAVAANCPWPQSLAFAPPLFVPALLVASLILITAALVLGNAPGSLFNNRLIRSLGKVSFSAYLVHFAVLHKLPVLLPAVFDVRHVTGWRAIVIFAALWAVALPITFGLSHLTYRAIEEPMTALGRRLARRVQPVQAAIAHSV